MQNSVKKNTYFVSIGQVSKMALAFVLFPFATRYLGPDGFANYALASTIMYFVFLFNDLGMNTYLVREVSKDLSRVNDFYISILLIKLFTILINGFLLFIFLKVLKFSAEANVAILIFAIYGFSTSIFELNSSVFRAYERMEFETLFTVIEKAVTTLAGIFVLVKGWGLHVFCLVFVFGGLLSILVSTALARRYFLKLNFSFNYQSAKNIIVKSLPFGISLFLANIYNSMGIILITKMQPATIAGWFATPVKLLKFTNILPMILSIAIFPALSRELKYSTGKFMELYTKGFKYSFYLAIPLIIGIFVLSDKIALTIFGEEFSESIDVLKILSLAAGLVFVNLFLAAVFNAANRQKMLVAIQLTALILNVVLNLILIPKYAHVGTGIAMVVTEGFIFIICFGFATLKIIQLQEKIFIVKTVAAAAVMCLSLVLIKNFNLAFVVVASSAVYFLTLYSVKGFTIEEIFVYSNFKFNLKGLFK